MATLNVISEFHGIAGGPVIEMVQGDAFPVDVSPEDAGENEPWTLALTPDADGIAFRVPDGTDPASLALSAKAEYFTAHVIQEGTGRVEITNHAPTAINGMNQRDLAVSGDGAAGWSVSVPDDLWPDGIDPNEVDMTPVVVVWLVLTLGIRIVNRRFALVVRRGPSSGA